MKKTVMPICLVVIIISALSACSFGPITFISPNRVQGSGVVTEATLPVTDFSGIDLATLGDVHIEFGSNEGLRIEAEDNLIPYFVATVVNGMLKIDTTPDTIILNPTQPILFYVTVVNLDSVTISGSGDIFVPAVDTSSFSASISGSGDIIMSDLNADAIDLSISGSGTIQGNQTDCTNLTVDISGSGNVLLQDLTANSVDGQIPGSGDIRIQDGMVENQTICLDGSGDYEAGNVESNSVDISINGSGKVTVRARNSLDSSINGSGDIRYFGNPTISHSNNGTGSLSSAGE